MVHWNSFHGLQVPSKPASKPAEKSKPAAEQVITTHPATAPTKKVSEGTAGSWDSWDNWSTTGMYDGYHYIMVGFYSRWRRGGDRKERSGAV